MEILIIAALIGLILAMIARSKGHDFMAWWIYGAALFIIALPHALLLRPNTKKIENRQLSVDTQRCPYCAEIIKAEAVVCRYCNRDLVMVAGPAGVVRPAAKGGEGGKKKTGLEKVLICAIAFTAIFVVIVSSQRGYHAESKAQPALEHQSSLAQPGDVVVARSASLCGSSPEAFDELVKWAVRKDTQEVYRTLLRTGSSLWTKGSEAKVLDRGGFMYGRTKIRILKTQRECWVPSEAVQ